MKPILKKAFDWLHSDDGQVRSEGLLSIQMLVEAHCDRCDRRSEWRIIGGIPEELFEMYLSKPELRELFSQIAEVLFDDRIGIQDRACLFGLLTKAPQIVYLERQLKFLKSYWQDLTDSRLGSVLNLFCPEWLPSRLHPKALKLLEKHDFPQLLKWIRNQAEDLIESIDISESQLRRLRRRVTAMKKGMKK